MNKTCLLLPLSICAGITGWAMAQESPPDAKLRIVALGDSITRGVRPGVTAEQTFSALLQAELNKTGREVEVLNVGIGGERTDGGLARLERDVIAKRPDIVLVMYGTNDSYVDQGKAESRITREAYAANLRQIVDKLQTAKIKPILMTEPRWGDAGKKNGVGEHPNVRLEKYLDACREVAKEKNLPLVDHFAAWTARNASGFDVGKWTTDQCHLNPAGHKVVAAAILKTLRDEKLVGAEQP